MLKKSLAAAAAVVALGMPAAEATFSVVALDPETGQLGVAVQSNTIAVGSRVRWGKAGVAAIASQAGSNPMMGEVGVLLIERGFSATEARDFLVRMDAGIEGRQFAIVDFNGDSAGWTGANNSGWAGHICQPNFCVEANTMTGPEVVHDMAIAYVQATEAGLPLAERLLNVLEAAEAAGGDRRGTESAGLLIFDQRAIADYGDWALDLRVDESEAPIPELRRIYLATRAGSATSGLNGVISSGDYERAFAMVDAALAMDPRRDAAYLQRAQIYIAMGNLPAAIEALATAIDLNPKQYYQILRNTAFETIWTEPAYQALGDYAAFWELAPSVPGKEGLPMPEMP